MASLSVALCTRNGARYIRTQLESVLGQTVPPAEIVVSDDASADDTVEVIERTLADWRRDNSASVAVRLIRNVEPLGVTGNFDQALAACAGDLILLCDQDDIWHAQKVELQAEMFDRRPALLLAASDARRVDEAGRELTGGLWDAIGLSAEERAAVNGGRAFAALLRRNVVTGATVMLRRELIALARPFPPSWVHDEWLAIVAAAAGEVALDERRLIDYRQHDANQIGASGLTGRGRLERLAAPRTSRNARLLERAIDLAERLPKLEAGNQASQVYAAQQKLAHEVARSAYAASRFRRIAPVLREMTTGRYATYGLGLQDVLRDLVQPV